MKLIDISLNNLFRKKEDVLSCRGPRRDRGRGYMTSVAMP
jgi:hypothetical protein